MNLMNVFTNPFGFTIIITIVLYFILKSWTKIRALILLKVLNRLIFIEKREAWFYYSEKKKKFSTTKSGWGCDINILDDDIKKFGLSTMESFEKMTSHRLINEKIVTYFQYLKLVKAFNDFTIAEYNPITITESNFAKDIKFLIEKSTLNVGLLLDERELFAEYYYFSPTESEINVLLSYLKKEGFITDTIDIWFTEKGLTSLNKPIDINNEILGFMDIIKYFK
jgi:hypothetical protein